MVVVGEEIVGDWGEGKYANEFDVDNDADDDGPLNKSSGAIVPLLVEQSFIKTPSARNSENKKSGLLMLLDCSTGVVEGRVCHMKSLLLEVLFVRMGENPEEKVELGEEDNSDGDCCGGGE